MEGTGMNWRKASYSNGGASNCVEVANSVRDVMIRDTKQNHLGTARTILRVPAGTWLRFTDSLR